MGAVVGLLVSLVPCAAQPEASRSERLIGPGVRLLQWSDPRGPNALQAVEIDRSEALVQLGVSLGGGEMLALEPLSRQAERLSRPERYAIAGVNGDFFYYPSARQPGVPTSAALLGEEVVRTPFDRSCLVLPASGAPSIRILRADAEVTLPDGSRLPLAGVNGPARANALMLYTPRWGASTHTDGKGVEVYLQPEPFPLKRGVVHTARVRAVQAGVGDAAIQPGAWVLSASGTAAAPLKALAPGDTLRVRVDFNPPLEPGDQVLGGGPRLLRDGKISVEAEGGSVNGSFASARHPRTAVGFAAGKVVLLVVDGRLPGYSAGMSLPELAQAMLDLGCTDAMNLDGGGSSTLWVRGSLVNRPSDGRERPVANGLLVFSTAPVGPPVRLTALPARIDALPGAEVSLAAGGEDRYYNPVRVPAGDVRWSVDPRLGRVEGDRFIAAAPNGTGPVEGVITAERGSLRGELPVRVLPRAARLEVLPAKLRLGTESQASFRVRAYDERGRPLLLPPDAAWEAAGDIGVVEKGVLKTGKADASGAVRATLNGVSAEAQVEVAAGVSDALDDFETRSDWTARLSPGAVGTVRVAEGTARSGKRALRLDYDLSGGGTRAVYALGTRDLGRPLALKAWVYGDGQGAWLRVRIRDKSGTTHLLDASRKVDWSGAWREVRVPVSEDLPAPITLEAFYVVETDAARKPRGTLLIDDLGVDY